MRISSINLVYYSATYTTREITRQIASQFGVDIAEYDLTAAGSDTDVVMNENELLVVGMPVYAGRIPAGMAAAISAFKGRNTPAVAVCVYGNRDYDDALLELKDAIENNGFRTMACGAFVARHSIFPHVAANRPDPNDMAAIAAFGAKCAALISGIRDTAHMPEIAVKGNRPYRGPRQHSFETLR